MSSRRRAREVIVQILFQRDLNPDADVDNEFQFLNSRLNGKTSIVQFAEVLLNGIRNHQEEIDAALQETAENWKLSRMAATDRSILRLAAYEVLFCPDTPGRVAINEAIELAKRYGTNNSFQFVNGILDRLHKSVEKSCETDGESTPNSDISSN